MKDKIMERTIKKVDFSEYKDKYDENLKTMLESSPNDMDLESVRALLYGYTFTEDYAKGIIPDELSMDYWEQKQKESRKDNPFDIANEICLPDPQDDTIDDDPYDVVSEQEKRILEAIDSTGDGKSEETALCVIDVGQEYEYMDRIFPYSLLDIEQQSLLVGGIDRIQFEENMFGIDCLYFDISRRFKVGYKF